MQPFLFLTFIFSATFVLAAPGGLNWQGMQIPRVAALEIEKQDKDSLRAKWSDGAFILVRSENGNLETARKLQEARALTILSTYSPRENPYPGFISKAVECKKSDLPVHMERQGSGLWQAGFKTFSNSRFALAGCRDDDKTFRTLQLVLHCAKASRIFEIKVMQPVSANASVLDDIFKSITCSL